MFNWRDETVFIVCGGTSVTPSMLAKIEGRKTIAVNSAYRAILWADMLFFADAKWIRNEMKNFNHLLKSYTGVITTTQPQGLEGAPKMQHFIHRKPPPGISDDPRALVVTYSSLQGALNLAFHTGSRRFIILGADNCSRECRIHSHIEYPETWKSTKKALGDGGYWELKAAALKHSATALDERKIEVFNCSPISTLTFWPRVSLEECL